MLVKFERGGSWVCFVFFLLIFPTCKDALGKSKGGGGGGLIDRIYERWGEKQK